MDDELVEKVAQALYATHGYICPAADDMFDDSPWEKSYDYLKERHRREARAAIAVMRDEGWKGPDPLQVALTKLADAQRPLDPEAAAAIYSNTEALYEK